MHAPTRLCANCTERKTVKGIWYLVAIPSGDEPTFFCESCYQRASFSRPTGSQRGRLAVDHLPLPGTDLGGPRLTDRG